MATTNCPRCQTPRVPDAKLCHQCGYAYEPAAQGWVLPSAGSAEPVRVTASFGTAFKLGAGFALGAMVIGIVVGIISTFALGALFAAAIGSVLQAVPTITP